MPTPDYYARLEIGKNASADDIKKAYRKLARKYHPDVSKEADAARHMSEVNEAHAVLSDPEKRKAYDEIGHQAWAAGARSADDVRPPPGWGETHFGRGAAGGGADGASFHHQAFGDDPSPFFEELFGRAARQRSRHAGGAGASWRGEDQYATIELSLAEAYAGAERTLNLETVGVDDAGQMRPERRTLSVKIPAGVGQDQLIRLAGQGQPGGGGGANGDLMLKVVIRTDARDRVEGRDLYRRVPVAPWEAALGGDITVHTPGGEFAVTVPAGSVAGRKLRLRGKGIPGKTPGDLYLELDIAVPGAVTTEQKAAWEALARAYPGFDPRPSA